MKLCIYCNRLTDKYSLHEAGYICQDCYNVRKFNKCEICGCLTNISNVLCNICYSTHETICCSISQKRFPKILAKYDCDGQAYNSKLPQDILDNNLSTDILGNVFISRFGYSILNEEDVYIKVSWKTYKEISCDCTWCRDTVMKSTLTEVTSSNGINHKLCKNCIKDFIECPKCGNTDVCRDEIFVGNPNYGGDIYEKWCRSCREDESRWCESCNRYESLDVLCDTEDWGSYVHTYFYKPTPKFLSTKDEITNIYHGFEIEFGGSSNNCLKLAKEIQRKYNKIFYFKEDESVDLEMVSHPMTLEYFKTLKDVFKDIANIEKNSNCKSLTDGRCGLHIHISRQLFTPLDLTKLDIFFSRIKDAIYYAISDRVDTDRLEHYAKISNTIQYRDEILRYYNMNKNAYRPDSRHRGLNFENKNTIEFRIFQSTTDWNRIYKNIEFIYSALAYIRVHSVAYILKSEYTKLITNYYEFVQSSGYNEFSYFIKNKKVKTCV